MEGLRDGLESTHEDAPDLFGNRQFYRCLRHITEHATDGLIRLIPFDVSEDVVLQHAERDGCNLGREVTTLAFAKIQKPLGFSERDLDGPAHRIYFVRFIGTQGGICGKQRIPFALLAITIEKEFNGCSGKVCRHLTIIETIMSGVFDMTLPLGFSGYDGIRRHGSIGRVVLGLGHFDHAQKMATYMSGLHELDQFLVGEPAVYKQIVEADSLQYGSLEETDKVVNLALEVLSCTLCRTAVRVALLAVSGIQLLLGQALRLGRLLSHFTLECEVHEGLRLSIRKQEEQALVAQDALVLNMGEDASKQFSFTAGLRKVGIIRNQTTGFRTLYRVASHGHTVKESAIEAVDNLPPVDVCIGKEAVEHVLLTGEHLPEDALGKVVSVLDGEEREQNHQLKDLAGRELAVRSLGKVNLPLVKRDVRHYVHDSLNRLRIVIFSKKAVEFRDYMPIFVHAKVFYIGLFGDTNIVIINEIRKFSQRNRP